MIKGSRLIPQAFYHCIFMQLFGILIHMPNLEKTSKKPWYHATIVTKEGKNLLHKKAPKDSTEFTELDLLVLVSGSRAFSKEFLESNKSILELKELDKPRELLVYPSATDGVVARVWAALELCARLNESSVLPS
jgi:hypothetical protein